MPAAVVRRLAGIEFFGVTAYVFTVEDAITDELGQPRDRAVRCDRRARRRPPGRHMHPGPATCPVRCLLERTAIDPVGEIPAQDELPPAFARGAPLA